MKGQATRARNRLSIEGLAEETSSEGSCGRDAGYYGTGVTGGERLASCIVTEICFIGLACQEQGAKD